MPHWRDHQHTHLKASPLDETDLVFHIQGTKSRDFLGEPDGVPHNIIKSGPESLPAKIGTWIFTSITLKETRWKSDAFHYRSLIRVVSW